MAGIEGVNASAPAFLLSSLHLGRRRGDPPSMRTTIASSQRPYDCLPPDIIEGSR